MMECSIIGDSIAVGIATQRFNCTVDAKIGISSSAIIGRSGNADITIVSAGSNDPTNRKLTSNLRAIRGRTKGRVIWIVPVHPTAAAAVRAVASSYGDSIVTFTPSRDNVHPRSYGAVAAEVRKHMEK